MQVEIWSDVACPWCYIGKRRFEGALKQFEHRDQVEVTWRSYQLDPTAARSSGQTVNEVLEKKMHLSREKAIAMNDHVSALAAQEGLDYHMEQTQYDNSFDAHRMVHLAAAHGKQDAMEERLFKAYFTDGLAIGDPEVLIQLAFEIGLDAAEARTTLCKRRLRRRSPRPTWSAQRPSVSREYLLRHRRGIWHLRCPANRALQKRHGRNLDQIPVATRRRACLRPRNAPSRACHAGSPLERM